MSDYNNGKIEAMIKKKRINLLLLNQSNVRQHDPTVKKAIISNKFSFKKKKSSSFSFLNQIIFLYNMIDKASFSTRWRYLHLDLAYK